MLLTKWNEVEDWVRTNGFKRVVVRGSDRSQGSDTERTNDCVFDSKNIPMGDMASKLEHLKWVLEHSERKVYATGFQSENAGTGGMAAELRLESERPAQQMQVPVGYAPVGQLDEQRMRESIMKEVRAEFERNDLDRERKAFEEERKEFNDVKNGVMGLLVEYGRPILGAMAAAKHPVVAGIDQPGVTEVEPIAPAEEAEEAEEQGVFTNEEADELFELMARFKKVEPDYMRMLRTVVGMAESGDATYKMAKGFLVK